MPVAVNQAAERVDVPSRTPRYYDPTGRVAADQRSVEPYPVYGARDEGALSRRPEEPVKSQQLSRPVVRACFDRLREP